MAGPRVHPLQSILLSPIDLSAAIQWRRAAPVPETNPRPGGTRVQLRGYDILEDRFGVKLPSFVEAITPDHTYVQYEDGGEPIVAKGGPTQPIPSRAGFDEGLRGQLKVTSEIRPASWSDDYRRGTKLVAETFVPGRTAKEVVRPAQAYSAGVNRGGNLYGAGTNSNSFAADSYERSTGRRPSAGYDTWGNETRLGEGGMSADLQRSRRLLGSGFGSTTLGQAVTRVAEDVGDRLGDRLLMFGY